VFDFKYVRDYEIATTRELYHEYIFCFDDGDGEKAAKRPRGAYYATLNNAQTLRKRRPRVRYSIAFIPQKLNLSFLA
jgi:RNA polymerase II-associated factor 1